MPDPTPEEIEGFKTRLANVAKARDEALASAKAQEESFTATLAEKEATIAALQAGRAEDLGMVAAGLHNPEAMHIARTMYASAPGDDKPPLPEWVGGFMADPAAAPGWLRGYLPAAAPAPPAAGAPPAPTPTPTPSLAPVVPPVPTGLPRTNGGVLPTPPPPSKAISVEDIRSMPDDVFQAKLADGSLVKAVQGG